MISGLIFYKEIMVIDSLAFTVSLTVCVLYTVYYALRRFNNWWYNPPSKEDSAHLPLPPGDMGWPFLGNMLTFLRAFKSTNPEAFISSFVSRFSRVGLYKAFMFGKPTILATTPEVCKLILMDDVHFIPGWPKSAVDLIGRKSFVGITFEEHKRLRKLTAAPVTGNEVLSKYLTWIEDTVVLHLEKWSNMDRIDFLTHMRKLTFDIIAHIFLCNETNEGIVALEREYTTLNLGVRAMAINFPGTAYNKALKARKNLVAILQSMIDRRRGRHGGREDKKVDMLDVLLKVKDQKGRLLEDEEIIDLFVMYLNAGHESSGHMTMWTVVFLLQNPEMYAKAKAEQEDIIRRRPEGQKNLVYSELREMEYLQQVINESLRLVSFSSMVFREAVDDVELNGYRIPKGWTVEVWMRNVHLDPEVYPNPKKFDPERWENIVPKPGMFVPFGLGSRLCPGNDLAKMEICIFIHCMVLEYEIQRLTPDCKVRYLPHPRPVDNCPVTVRKLKSP